jgi:hypothetical protein
MVQFKPKLPMEQLLGITDFGNKENKLQQIQLQAFLHGQEVYYIELNLIIIKNLIISAQL